MRYVLLIPFLKSASSFAFSSFLLPSTFFKVVFALENHKKIIGVLREVGVGCLKSIFDMYNELFYFAVLLGLIMALKVTSF
ncbi:hypothetical protein ES332_D02G258800v1 [Gossypium tomentosum]|uniref:Uncharacterized protein n=1 Tax=Gossypium tomentosum TaxID=34277 RepID=A0A5D2M1V5_GOSTO|nr:hypothetical protein ES332_D02G258800v1 [Gossypium tomentosum]